MYVCRLSQSCTLLKLLDGMWCHLAGTLMWSEGSWSTMGRGDLGVRIPGHSNAAVARLLWLLFVNMCSENWRVWFIIKNKTENYWIKEQKESQWAWKIHKKTVQYSITAVWRSKTDNWLLFSQSVFDVQYCCKIPYYRHKESSDVRIAVLH